ncbi:hypothetical protein MRX96_043008 [Rhipicephalus microplus]
MPSAFLRRMKGNIKRLINDLSWMNGDSKCVAFSKLDNMKTRRNAAQRLLSKKGITRDVYNVPHVSQLRPGVLFILAQLDDIRYRRP